MKELIQSGNQQINKKTTLLMKIRNSFSKKYIIDFLEFCNGFILLIGGADGPTTVYVAVKRKRNLDD